MHVNEEERANYANFSNTTKYQTVAFFLEIPDLTSEVNIKLLR
jgi:hypothetical protein